MPAASSTLSGFAEAGGCIEQSGWPSDRLAAAVAAALEKARRHTQARHEQLVAARTRTEANRRTEERKRRDRTRRWTVARAKLVAAVLAVDRAIAPEGMALSMSDADAHPADLAAAEVRASVLGRPVRALLQIVVSEELTLRARIVDAEVRAPVIKLRAAARIEAREFGEAILAYLECALPQPEGCHRICRTCGCFLPA